MTTPPRKVHTETTLRNSRLRRGLNLVMAPMRRMTGQAAREPNLTPSPHPSPAAHRSQEASTTPTGSPRGGNQGLANLGLANQTADKLTAASPQGGSPEAGNRDTKIPQAVPMATPTISPGGSSPAILNSPPLNRVATLRRHTLPRSGPNGPGPSGVSWPHFWQRV